MSTEEKAYRGRFKGYYTAKKFDITSGPRSYEIDWEKIVISDFKETTNYHVENLEIGVFSYLKKTKKFKILNSDIIINKGELRDVVLKDFEIVKSVQKDDEFYVIVEGDIYAKNPPKPTPRSLKNFFPSNLKDNTSLETPIENQDNLQQTNSNTPSASSAFFRFITTGFGFVFFLIVVSLFQNPLNIFFGILLAAFLVGFGRFRFFRNPFFQILGILLLITIIGTLIFEYNSSRYHKKEKSKDKQTEEANNKDDFDRDNDKKEQNELEITEFFSHNHRWKNYKGRSFSGIFKVRKDHYYDSKNYREYDIFNDFERDRVFTENNLQNFNFKFRKLYEYSLKNEIGKLPEIIQLYSNFKKRRNLSNKQFAELIVSSIQYIPYVLICQEDCNICKIRTNYVGDCLGNILFGFQSPVEFMSNFKGDCDTKVLLCFYILKKFGYDVAILISERFEHAVLGINLNVGGSDYVYHRGVKYYAWETTSEGFKPGYLSREDKRMRYWDVCLTSREIKL